MPLNNKEFTLRELELHNEGTSGTAGTSGTSGTSGAGGTVEFDVTVGHTGDANFSNVELLVQGDESITSGTDGDIHYGSVELLVQGDESITGGSGGDSNWGGVELLIRGDESVTPGADGDENWGSTELLIQGDETITPDSSGDSDFSSVELLIQGDETVTASGPGTEWGDTSIFESAAVAGGFEYMAAADANDKIVVVYRDSGNSNYGTVVVGDMGQQPPSVTWGTPVVFNSSNTTYMDVAFQNGEGFVIAYSDQGATNSWARGGTISGTTPSLGNAATLESGYKANGISVTNDSDVFIVAYKSSYYSNRGYYRVVKFSTGNNITYWGGGYAFGESGANNTYISAVSNGYQSAIFSRDQGNGNIGVCKPFDASSTTVQADGLSSYDQTYFTLTYNTTP